MEHAEKADLGPQTIGQFFVLQGQIWPTVMRMANAIANRKPRILHSPAPKPTPRIAENTHSQGNL